MMSSQSKLPGYLHSRALWGVAVVALGCVYALLLGMHPMYLDFDSCVLPWVEYLRDIGGLKGLMETRSNYSPPYLYILYAIAHVPAPPLLLVKGVSILFAVVGAVMLGLIVYVKHRRLWVIPCVATLALAIPTVLVNNAYWAQCDSIFTTFVIAGIYALMRRRRIVSMICVGVAFAFKMQTVFIFPLYFVLWLRRDLKWWMPLVAVGACGVMWLPAMLCGVSLHDVLAIYFDQAQSYMTVTLNLPNIWMIYPRVMRSSMWLAGAMVALILAVSVWVYRGSRKQPLSYDYIVDLAFLSAIFVPLVLTSMHERYLYLGDILTVVYICYNPRMWRFAAFIPVVSILGYTMCLGDSVYWPTALMTALHGLAALVSLTYVYVTYRMGRQFYLTYMKMPGGATGLKS